jgi:excisionase family DNA binding protein
MNEQPYVTTLEAAKLLHVSARTLERRRSRGDGPRFHKAGRRVLYRIDEIEAWLSSNGFNSTSEYKGK